MSKNKTNKDDINATDEHGWSAVHYFAANGMNSAIELFAKGGADLNLLINTNESNMAVSPIILAIRAGHIKAVQRLVELGADVNKADQYNMTPLMYAMQHKKCAIEVTKILVSGGVDVKKFQAILQKHGDDILSKALNVQPECVKELSEVIKNPEETKIEGGVERSVENLFIDLKINKQDKPIDIEKAFIDCDIESITKYIKDANIKSEDKYTANFFAAAAMEGSAQYTKLMVALLQSGYDINRPDSDGITAIQKIIMQQNINAVALNLALVKGADVNALGENGYNAVHYAILNSHYNTLNTLLSCGGDPDIKTSKGELPMTLVMQSEYNMEEMFYVMTKHGVDLGQYDLEGLKSIAGELIDPDSVDFMESAWYADSLYCQKATQMSCKNVNVLGARLSFYMKNITEDEINKSESLQTIAKILKKVDWKIHEIEEVAEFASKFDWKEIAKLPPQALEKIINQYLNKEVDDVSEIQVKEDPVSVLKILIKMAKNGELIDSFKKYISDSKQELYKELYEQLLGNKTLLKDLDNVYDYNNTDNNLMGDNESDV